MNNRLNRIIQNPETEPNYLNRGCTTLIYKGGEKEKSKSYIIIVCLPIYSKLTTFILTNKMYDHITITHIFTD